LRARANNPFGFVGSGASECGEVRELGQARTESRTIAFQEIAMRRIAPATHHRMPRRLVRAVCQVVRERDFTLVADQVVDLSPGGALVMPADPVLTGERVILSFKLPFFSNYIDAEGTVARVVHGRRPGEHSRGLAIRFDHVAGLDQYLLERTLRYLPPAPPGYRPGRRQTEGLLRDLCGKG
jgi:hypothetical protein